MNLTGTCLDDLFRRWIAAYPPRDQRDFHRDGAVDDASYWREQHRLVFLMTEANSKGKYDHYKGWDLRVVLGQETLNKEFNINMGLWVRSLLDGEVPMYRPTPEEAERYLRRIAAINLKKIGGHGTASLEELCAAVLRDREFILEEIEILKPTTIITCGPKANRAFGLVSTGNPDYRAPSDDAWLHRGVLVIPGNSPSIRPYQRQNCFDRLMRRARKHRVGAFDRSPEVRSPRP